MNVLLKYGTLGASRKMKKNVLQVHTTIRGVLALKKGEGNKPRVDIGCFK